MRSQAGRPGCRQFLRMSTSVVLVLAGCGGGAGWGDGTFDEASQSALGSACAEGQTACADGCTDTSSDGTNCGSCGNNCGSDACCEGVCVNLEQDATNCGACGAVCSTAESCYDGSCSAGSEIVCDGGSCTSPGSKPEKGSLGIDIGTPLGTAIRERLEWPDERDLLLGTPRSVTRATAATTPASPRPSGASW